MNNYKLEKRNEKSVHVDQKGEEEDEEKTDEKEKEEE